MGIRVYIAISLLIIALDLLLLPSNAMLVPLAGVNPNSPPPNYNTVINGIWEPGYAPTLAPSLSPIVTPSPSPTPVKAVNTQPYQPNTYTIQPQIEPLTAFPVNSSVFWQMIQQFSGSLNRNVPNSYSIF